MPNTSTFEMPKLREFVERYLPNFGIILVPFAGTYRFDAGLGRVYVYNDLNPDIKADHHVEAADLVDLYGEEYFDAIIADPPYTHTQAHREYNGIRVQKMTPWRIAADKLLKPGGIYIELGYNSTGLRKKIAEKIALGICCCGGGHNDILTLVQRKRLKPKKVMVI